MCRLTSGRETVRCRAPSAPHKAPEPNLGLPNLRTGAAVVLELPDLRASPLGLHRSRSLTCHLTVTQCAARGPTSGRRDGAMLSKLYDEIIHMISYTISMKSCRLVLRRMCRKDWTHALRAEGFCTQRLGRSRYAAGEPRSSVQSGCVPSGLGVALTGSFDNVCVARCSASGLANEEWCTRGSAAAWAGSNGRVSWGT